MVYFMMIMILMYFISLLLFKTMFSHLLMTLMSLEIMMMSLMMIMYMYMLLLSMNYFLKFFLLIVVCEGVYGSSLTSFMVPFKGMEKFTPMDSMLW
uniref:NADH dehydrogenase subunit 4L n=1 Tax=Latuspina sp. TaxID=3138292 RepID=A0AB38ZLF1_9HYME